VGARPIRDWKSHDLLIRHGLPTTTFAIATRR
jgi:hypothetical protein